MSAASAKAAEPSMEEILASIRRIIADDHEAATGEAEASEEPPALELTIADTAFVDAMPPLEDASPSVPAPSLLDLDHEDVTFDQTPPAAPPPEPEPVAFARPAPDPAPAPAAEPPLRPETLISREATASIGQAFHMLSHTVLTQNARTLEDLVQDMLKPMLKTWLDDNLPAMVERLIRAEIERVARGR